jgi:putative NIF3 family GTP cyclohydrolase 1 type 2
MPKIKDIVEYLEAWAPPTFQEPYDNAGLITGDMSEEVTGVVIALDCIEAVVEDAIGKNCNLVVAHHPIIFKGIRKLTGKNYIEKNDNQSRQTRHRHLCHSHQPRSYQHGRKQ